ncbi:hypothetical protein ACYOEI_06895 [Singulisphaera rosea]
MSQSTVTHEASEQAQLAKLCATIRGKLQFMDYLVRAAVADVDRFQDESDAGTRIFIRQLIEMHAANLTVESENMRLVGELCSSLEAVVNGPPNAFHEHEHDHDHHHQDHGHHHQNGESE